MSRRVTVTLDLDALPEIIGASLRAVLAAHKLRVIDAATVPLDRNTLEMLSREVGRNASQCVLCADTELAEVPA